MKLSDIDSSPYFPIEIPSNKQKTKFRPFRVREERALLIAQESEDPKIMINTLETIVKSCVVDCPSFITTFDVEYLFIQIRAKSVGEVADAVSTCTHCSEKNNIQLDLTTTKIVGENIDKKIKLSDDLVVLMKFPSISDVADLMEDKENLETKAIVASIETVYYGSTVLHTKDTDAEDIAEFLLNRSDDEMDKLIEFINNIPTVILEMDYKCTKCGENNHVEIKTLQDFF